DRDKGLSVIEYFTGWTGRILDETADHQTALWLRLNAMLEEILALQPREMINVTESLLYQVDASGKERLLKLVDRIDQVLAHDLKNLSAFRFMLVDYYENQSDYEQVIHYGEQIIETDPDSSVSIKTRERLLVVYAPNSPFNNQQKYQEYAQALARNALVNKNITSMCSFYDKFFSSSTKEQCFKEVQWIIKQDKDGTLLSELIINFPKYHALKIILKPLTQIAERDQIYRRWRKDLAEIILSEIQVADLMNYPNSLKYWIKECKLPKINQNSNNLQRKEFYKQWIKYLDWSEVKQEVEGLTKSINGKESIIDVLSAWETSHKDTLPHEISEFKKDALQAFDSYFHNKAKISLAKENYDDAFIFYYQVINNWDVPQFNDELTRIVKSNLKDEIKKTAIIKIIQNWYSLEQNNSTRESIFICMIRLESMLPQSMFIEILYDIRDCLNHNNLLRYLKQKANNKDLCFTSLEIMIDIVRILKDPIFEKDLNERLLESEVISNKELIQQKFIRLSELYSHDDLRVREKCLAYCIKSLNDKKIKNLNEILDPYFTFFNNLNWEDFQKDIRFIEKSNHLQIIPLVMDTWVKKTQNRISHQKALDYIFENGLKLMDFRSWEHVINNLDMSVLLMNPDIIEHLFMYSITFKDNLENDSHVKKMRIGYENAIIAEKSTIKINESWLMICKILSGESITGLNASLRNKDADYSIKFLNLLISSKDYSNIEKIDWESYQKNNLKFPEETRLILKFLKNMNLLYSVSDINKTKFLNIGHLYKIIEAFNTSHDQSGAMMAVIILNYLVKKVRPFSKRAINLLAETLVYAGMVDKARKLISKYKLTHIGKDNLYVEKFIRKNSRKNLNMKNTYVKIEEVFIDMKSTWKII
ncbi:MAG: hypothetical protein K0B14_14960, partial [Anaerolineaceae bacterium]|nr:hypothetical protein [Anaerolineaceae bacterium]